MGLTITRDSCVPEAQRSEPYEDWTPLPNTWNNSVPHLPTPPSDTTTLADDEAQVGIADAWPSPPLPPLKGTDMQPPIEEFSGAHPGRPWEYNTIGSPNYFCLLIPDPAMPRRQIVTPYIKYNSDLSHPEISGTFGRDYPIITRALRPTPVDYLCPVLTPAQVEILDPEHKAAGIIDWILGEHCPHNLHAGVGQYQHYLNACRTTQKQINALQECHMHFLKKRMEVLSDLENANVLGRILAHTEEFDGQPEAYASFFKAMSPFCGHITYSGTNVAIDHYMSGAITLGPPAVSTTVSYDHMTCADVLRNPTKSICKPVSDVSKPPPYIHLTYADALRNSITPFDKKTMQRFSKPLSAPSGPRSTCNKRCHKCRKLGHIRRECPTHQGKKKVFFHK